MQELAFEHASYTGWRAPCCGCGRRAPRPMVPTVPTVCPACAFARAVRATAAAPLPAPPDPARELGAELDRLAADAPRLAGELRALFKRRLAASASPDASEGPLASVGARKAADPASLRALAARAEADGGPDPGPEAAALGPCAPRRDQDALARRSGVGTILGTHEGLVVWSYGDPITPRRALILTAAEAHAVDAPLQPWPAPASRAAASIPLPTPPEGPS